MLYLCTYLPLHSLDESISFGWVEMSELHAGGDALRGDQPVAYDRIHPQLPAPDGPSCVPRPSPSSWWSFSMVRLAIVRTWALSAASSLPGEGSFDIENSRSKLMARMTYLVPTLCWNVVLMNFLIMIAVSESYENSMERLSLLTGQSLRWSKSAFEVYLYLHD